MESGQLRRQVEDSDAGDHRREGLPYSLHARAWLPSPRSSAATSRRACWSIRTRITGCSSRRTAANGTARCSAGWTSGPGRRPTDPTAILCSSPAKAGVQLEGSVITRNANSLSYPNWTPAFAGEGFGRNRVAFLAPPRLEASHHDRAPKTFDPAEIEIPLVCALGGRGPVPPRSPGRRALDDRQPAAERDGLSAYRPCARQHACRTCWSATRGSRARMRSGWSAPTMPASPRRWWSSGGWPRCSRSAPISPARNSWRRSGNGRPKAAARSRSSCAGSAARWTGPMNASRWTRASRKPSSRCSSTCTIRG